MMVHVNTPRREIPNGLQIGLGAYPGEPWYNPDRPSWVPYWFDTPTETQAKYTWMANQIGLTQVTAQQVASPGTVYAPPRLPPPAPAVQAGTSTVPAPYECLPGDISRPDCPGYEEAVNVALARQMEAWKAQNQADMEALNKEVNPLASYKTIFWITVAGVAALVLMRR